MKQIRQKELLAKADHTEYVFLYTIRLRLEQKKVLDGAESVAEDKTLNEAQLTESVEGYRTNETV